MASAVLLALDRLALSPVVRLVENTGLRTVAIELTAGLTARQIIARAAESGARTLFLHADLPLANGAGGMRGGLRILEDLVLEEANPGSVVITSFEPSEQLRRSLTPSITDGRPAILPRRAVGIEFLQLPATESAWRRALERATRSHRLERVKRKLGQARQRLVLAQKAAEDGAFRHRVENYRAAMRLLQGAMYAGCISSETYLDILGTVARRPEGGTLQELAEIVNEAQRAAARYSGLYPSELPLHSGLWQQALLIDDQAKSAGWEVVMRQVLGRRLHLGIRSCTSIDEGLREAAERSDLAAVLLDYRFGEERVGRDTVTRLQELQHGVPIIMFTAHNDVPTAMRLHQQGVWWYFVKEPDEDNAPLPYYEALIRAVEDAARAARRNPLFGAFRVLLRELASTDLIDASARRQVLDAIGVVGPRPAMQSLVSIGQAMEGIIERLVPGGALPEGAESTTYKRIGYGLYRSPRAVPNVVSLATQMRNAAVHNRIPRRALRCIDTDISLWALFTVVRRFCIGNSRLSEQGEELLEDAGKAYMRSMVTGLNRLGTGRGGAVATAAAELGSAAERLFEEGQVDRTEAFAEVHRLAIEGWRRTSLAEQKVPPVSLFHPRLMRELAETERLPEARVLAALIATRLYVGDL